MRPRPFALERYFAAHEFTAAHLLSASDCESLGLPELLALADGETRALWDGLRLGYTESQGHPLLREEVARLYESIGPADSLLAAPEELIFLAMQALLAPGDHVIATYPGYQSLYALAESLGCQVTRWAFAPVGNGWALDMDFLADHLTDQTRLLVINFPHNPTGHLVRRDELETIIALARRHGTYLFSDEMYRLLELDTAARLPSACDRYERALTLSGLSKAFGLPGLRLGWIATQDRELLGQLAVLHDYTTICNSAPSEILGLIAIRAREHILQRNLALVRTNLDGATRFFASHEEIFRWLPPQAGSVAFPQWLGEGTVERFCAEAMAHTDVMIVPGSMFEFEGGHFRIGLGRADFPAALARVDDYLEGASASH
jgi:aspartate/methionine/tyrosine aminotransferase